MVLSLSEEESHIDKQAIQQQFCQSIRQGNFYRAHLFLGIGDEEKDPFLDRLASLLLCERGIGVVCRRCPACLKIAGHIHPDVRIVAPQAERRCISMEQIREVVAEASTRPWESRYKIFLLYDVHQLNEEAANALLKTLEEPPETVVFFLTARDRESVLETIASRCQIVSLTTASVDSLAETLVQQHGFSPLRAHAAAVLAEGSVETALAWTSDDWKVRDWLCQSLAVGDRDPLALAEEATSLCGSGEAARQKAQMLLAYLAALLRDVLVLSLGGTDALPQVINQDRQDPLAKLAQCWNSPRLMVLLDFLTRAQEMIQANVSVSLIWENFFLQLSLANNGGNT